MQGIRQADDNNNKDNQPTTIVLSRIATSFLPCSRLCTSKISTLLLSLCLHNNITGKEGMAVKQDPILQHVCENRFCYGLYF